MKQDPRYHLLKDFWIKYGSSHDLLENIERAAHDCSKLFSGELRNPIPNSDLMAGGYLYSFGVKEPKMVTALMGMSRTLGSLANYILDRECELPIEYAISVDLADIREILHKQVVKST